MLETMARPSPSVTLRPDHPVLTLRANAGIRALVIHELWQYRELLVFLTWRELRIRYKQTALGALWALVQPLFPMLIFTVTLGKFVGVPSDGAPYAIFAYAALLPWTYFANAVTSSANSVVANAGLITKVYFPRLIIPAAAVLSALADFLVALGLLGVLMAWYRIPVHASLMALPVLVVLVTVLALGTGMLFSALTVRYRDVRHVLPFAIQLWMFATPVLFPASLVPPEWRWLLAINPMTSVIEGFRAAVLGRALNVASLAATAVIAAALLAGSIYVFRRFERTFADSI